MPVIFRRYGGVVAAVSAAPAVAVRNVPSGGVGSGRGGGGGGGGGRRGREDEERAVDDR